MTLTQQYIRKCRAIADKIEAQEKEILRAAQWFAESILAGRMVHVFGSGHSRIMVEEMWPRYGSFPGFNPIVELSLTYHNNVVGPNGQPQGNRDRRNHQRAGNPRLSRKDQRLHSIRHQHRLRRDNDGYER